METYLARQPILDRGWNVAGYELLFPSNRANLYDAPAHVAGASLAAVSAFPGSGPDRLPGRKPALINFDRSLFLGDCTTLLPPERTVIGILKTVPPDDEVLAVCRKLRKQGYALALADCLEDERTLSFAPFVDILKVDFQQTSLDDQENILRRFRKLGMKMVAGKVDSESEFRRARQLGYDYFQGFFFAPPAVPQGARLPSSRLRGLRLVQQTQQQELDLRALEELIRRDVELAHSLLKYLNSAAFRWADRIGSVRQALALLGSDEIRKWAWMASLSSLGQNRPAVLMAQVLTRGRFCEEIARSAKLSTGYSDPFLIGMFSLLDAVMQRPLEEVLGELNISKNIRNALLGTAFETDSLSLLLRIVKSYEIGHWDDVDAAARFVSLSPQLLTACYFDSLSWVEAVFSPDEQKGRADRLSAPIDFHRNREVCQLPQH